VYFYPMNRLLRNNSGYTLLEIIFVISIILILSGMLIPQLMANKNTIIEQLAKRRLRTIGSVMTDYALSNTSGNYADFQDLKDADLIQKQRTLTSLITDYSLVFFTQDRPVTGIGSPAYTIIAYPRPERSYGRLNTFAITEDNVVRVYKPGPRVSPTDPGTWEPIL
jgi:prepilin-type N-terminal cleavage/methylation domain-containing protein